MLLHRTFVKNEMELKPHKKSPFVNVSTDSHSMQYQFAGLC